MNAPWWRAQNGHWYVKVHGKQHRLTEEADPDGGRRKKPPPHVEQAWHRLIDRKDDDAPKDLRVREMCDLFGQTCADEPKNLTGWALGRFQSFVGAAIWASQLRPYHLTDFFKANPQWSPSTQRTITNRVLAAVNYAVREGRLDKNPISSTPGYRRHGYHTKREGVVDPALRQRLEDAAHPALRAFLVGLRETGARPVELRRARIERCFLDKGVLYVPNKTARKTGKEERTIYLSPGMKELVRELAGSRTEGFIFLTARGKPWTFGNMEQRWQKLTEKVQVPGGITLYTYRRTFISTAINETNVNPALVALLAGHSDLTMLLKHYLQEDPEALKRAVDEITKKDEGKV